MENLKLEKDRIRSGGSGGSGSWVDVDHASPLHEVNYLGLRRVGVPDVWLTGTASGLRRDLLRAGQLGWRGSGRWVGLDMETTGLKTNLAGGTTVVRLIQIYVGGVGWVIDLYNDLGRVDMALLAEVVAVMRLAVSGGCRFVCWNGCFEMSMLRWACAELGVDELEWLDAGIEDAKLLRGCLIGGNLGLGPAVSESFEQVGPLDKSHQKSDWGGVLSEEHYFYAIDDARWALALWKDYKRLLDDIPGGTKAFVGYSLMKRAQGPVCEMVETGLVLDEVRHSQSVKAYQRAFDRYTRYLDTYNTSVNNWNSSTQIVAFAEEVLGRLGAPGQMVRRQWPRTASGRLSMNRKTGLPYACRSFKKGCGVWKVFKALSNRAKLSAVLSTFGESLANKADKFGVVRGDYIIAGTKTGRMSGMRPNLQQIPSGGFRDKWRAGPGKVLVGADYSQIELRIAAGLSDDEVLRGVFERGEDAHEATAKKMFGVAEALGANMEQRRAAKAVNFGVLYGMSAAGLSKGLSYGVPTEKSQADAVDYLEKWAFTYPTLWKWRESQMRKVGQTGRIVTVSGRIIQVGERASPTIVANFPVQGSAADVIYKALALVRTGLYRADIDAFLAAVVHDEIILRVGDDPETIGIASKILEDGMTDAFSGLFSKEPVLGLVKAKVGLTWADIK